MLAQGTGEFAKSFKEKSNEIVIQVARAEPTTGAVLEAGVQRWNDNGSADVLVATKIRTTAADGKTHHRERKPLGGNDYRGGTAVEDQPTDSGDLTADAAAATVPQGKAARNRHRLPRQKATVGHGRRGRT